MEQDCKKQISESLNMDGKIRKYRYCVLYTNALKQSEVCYALKKALPGNRGTVFYPCMECYRRDAGGEITIQPIFPGYIFIRSDMEAVELHEFIRNNCSQIMAFVHELKLSQRKAAGEEVFVSRDKSRSKNAFSGSGIIDEKYDFSDLTEKEAEFLDFLLDADNTGGEMSGSAEWDNEKNDLSVKGLLKMSYGYQEGKQYKVMKGPLRAYENHIASVNKHDKKAFLDFEINGKVVRAGFDVMPKRYWFPEDEDTPDVLTDGTEVDLQELAKAMMCKY